MSKIRLTGSNSGYVEIASAADAGNLTFVLPTSGTSLLGNGHNVYTGITTFTNDLKLEGGSYDVLWDASDNQLEFDDNAILSFGADSDLKLYHNGNHSYIDEAGTGNLYIRNGTKNSIWCQTDGQVNLYHNDVKKFETAESGAIVTGIMTATTFAPTSEQLSHRNIAINGDMKVAQRGTSTTSVSASGYYACDRMRTYCYVGSERYTVSQVAEAPTGSGFTKSFKIQTTTADTSANAGTFLTFQYSIEGQDVQHLLKGTSSAKPITLSFWVKGNTNYTPVAELRDDNSRLNVQTFNVTSSWTKIVLTYVGDTTGTIDDDNTSGLSLNIWLKASAFYSGGTSPAQNTWVPQSNHNIRAALLTFDIAASTSNYFQITGLQIEVGSIATPFEHRSFGDELSRCQRYFQRVEGHSDMVCAGPGRSNGTTNAPFTIPLSVPLRASPTVNACAWAIFTSNNQANSASQTPAVTKWDAYNNVLTCQLAGLSGMTNARALNVFINSSNTFTMDAEL